MIGTDRDLAQMREAIDYELLRLTILRKMPLGLTGIDDLDFEIIRLRRERIALCAAVVNRRMEAKKPIVSFARWASGNGALDSLFSRHRPRFVPGGCAAPIPLVITVHAGKGVAR